MANDIAFVGSIPQHYDLGLGPVMFEPYAIETAARLPKLTSGAILEIACGTGRVTRHIRATQPASVRVVATDLSEPMLAYSRSSGLSGVEWTQADAQDLPFDDISFDAVVCQFGVMFFPDKSLALREFARVLKPGGVVLAATWDKRESVEIVELNHKLLMHRFAEDPPSFMDVPFSMYDPVELERLFSESFGDVKVEKITHEIPIVDFEAAARGLIQGSPLANQILERDPAAPEELVKVLIERLKANPVSRSIAWIVTGHKA
jgi:ubiquinone/menaquinone biosynthesis C-methylase UbiE